MTPIPYHTTKYIYIYIYVGLQKKLIGLPPNYFFLNIKKDLPKFEEQNYF